MDDIIPANDTGADGEPEKKPDAELGTEVETELGADVESPNVVVKERGAKRRKLRKLLLKLSLALTVLAPLIFIVAALGAKLGLWGWKFGLVFLTQKMGLIVLGLGAIIGVLAMIAAVMIQPRTRKGVLIAALGILVPFAGVVKMGQTKSTVAKLPAIHDVTTDTQAPPVFGEVILAERAATKGVNTLDYLGKMAPVTKKNGAKSESLVAALQTKAYPQIRPVIINENPEAAFAKALATAKSMGWTIKEENQSEGPQTPEKQKISESRLNTIEKMKLNSRSRSDDRMIQKFVQELDTSFHADDHSPLG